MMNHNGPPTVRPEVKEWARQEITLLQAQIVTLQGVIDGTADTMAQCDASIAADQDALRKHWPSSDLPTPRLRYASQG